jgi:hypothetical protein
MLPSRPHNNPSDLSARLCRLRAGRLAGGLARLYWRWLALTVEADATTDFPSQLATAAPIR